MLNDKIQMTNEIKITNNQYSKRKYDIEDRTLLFSKKCIDICKSILKDPINMEITGQLIRSSTSVGANYREANESITKKNFYHIIGICRREAKESKYWLELLRYANSNHADKITLVIDEAFQLTKIFASIGKNAE
jgi:four helix bundle protein